VTAYCGVAPELLRELESLKEGESGRTNGKASMRGLILCRLVPVKACDVVLRAAGMLGEEGRRVELKIAGDGPERSRLESLARELRIDDRLEFLGYVGDVRAKARLLLESDFLIQSGRYDAQSKRVEHFGIVFAEAGAAGLPVIAPNIGGVPEVVRDGETGILIPPDDPESAAAAIRTLASDPGRTAAMGRAGRRRVAELFDYEKIAGKIIQEMSDAIRHDS
jgi:glycosyltransferase involved in cell wall biosynthesis